jgi:dTDP-4-dehydrorhamnose 3,5-epimerase
MKVVVASTPFDGVVIVEGSVFGDERGFFMESWNEREFAAAGLQLRFVQDSHSRSTRGVLRGLHYQDMTAPTGKLVRCTVGEIFDAVVDLRVGSATLGKWYGLELTAENKRQIYIPPGFAHGFQALTDAAEVQYKQTELYTPAAEKTIAWNDPDLGIAWPIPNPILSNRDQRGMSLKDYLSKPDFRYSPST